MSEQGADVIRLDGVRLCHGSGPAVLDGLDLALPPGAVRWLFGAPGAGKTSLLRVLALGLRHSAGHLQVLGARIGATPRAELPGLRRRIGMVCQDGRLLPHLSVFDNIALPLRLGRRPDTELRADVTDMLRWAGLLRHATTLPAALSGGQRQLAAIARAVIARPALLLADEPVTHLDDAEAGRLMELLAELGRLGTTILMATSVASVVARHPVATLVLQDGRLRDGAA